MTDYSVTTSKHATLTISTVDTVTVAAASAVEILNRSSADTIYVRTGANPTVAGDNTLVVPAGTSLKIQRRTADDLIVRLISSAAAPYSVTAIL